MIMQLNEIYRLKRHGSHWCAEEACEFDVGLHPGEMRYRPITQALSAGAMLDYLSERDASGQIMKHFMAACAGAN